jgi:arylsulfatase A-like enzyme
MGMLGDTLIIFMTDNGMSVKSETIHGGKFRPFNAALKGGKCSPEEGGARVPSFWIWKGHVSEDIDLPALAVHIDHYRAFCELAGAEIPPSSIKPTGCSLVPLLENPSAKWPERTLFTHVGRWDAGKWSAHKDQKYAARSNRWRLVNNEFLYDILSDRGQKKDVAAEHLGVVAERCKRYNAWGDSLPPLLVNEGLPNIKGGDFPLQKLRETKRELPH